MQDISRLVDLVQQYAVAYGFQILGALVVLLVGLKVASLAGRWVRRVALGRGIDVTRPSSSPASCSCCSSAWSSS